MLFPSLITQVESRSWSQTQGTIVRSEVNQKCDSTCKVDHKLLYRYQVDGKPYRGTRYNAIHPLLVENWQVDRLAKELSVDSTVTVYYHEADPAQSLLQPGIDAQVSLLLLGMLFPVTFSISACFHLVDQELRFLLPAEKYELYNTPTKTSVLLWTSFCGVVALSMVGGCLIATDYAPTNLDALAAWGAFIAASWLIFRWANRLAVRELAQKIAAKERLISDSLICP